MPVYEDLTELSSVQYYSFDEQRLDWMKTVRQLKTGHCFGKFVDNDHLYRILIDHSPVRATQQAEQRYLELLQRNYEQDFFISREEADRLAEQARIKLLQSPRIELSSQAATEIHFPEEPKDGSPSEIPDPFRRPSVSE